MTVTTTEKDPLANRQLLIYGAGAVLALIWAVVETVQGRTPSGIIFFLLGGALAYQAYAANSMRAATVTMGPEGVRRAGSWGWNLPWEKVSSAHVEDVGGQDYLVVMRLNPAAPNHFSASGISSSTIPRNALVSPIPWDRCEEVAAVIARYARA
nr:hypothetical protein [Actinomycetales bacterium]